MKTAIVVFSPAGNTLKVAKMLQENLKNSGIQVQLLDITRNRKLFHEKNYRKFLSENVEEHDLLMIGSPVYAHHIHYNMINVMKALPKADDKWSKSAVPFVTYGGISSGIALYEAAKILRQTGRIIISGMKISTFHVMSRVLSKKQNEGMSGEETIPVIQEMTNRIVGSSANTCKDITNALDYQNAKSKMKAKLIFREKIWQNLFYPKLIYNDALCTGCGKCVSSCPVQRLELKDRRVLIGKNKPACIHCTQCVYVCPVNALDFKCDKEKWDKLFIKAVSGKGPFPSNEEPKSAVYP